MYESTSKELQQTKESLIFAEMAIKKLTAELRDKSTEVERYTKNSEKKDTIIRQLNFELEKLKQVELWESLHDSGLLGENFEYEERIRSLEREIEDLKIDNANLANKELVRLENILQQQKQKSLKADREKGYFEERWNVLEKQNQELKTRVENLQMGKCLYWFYI